MNLFGNDKDTELEPETLATLAEEKAEAVSDGLVMNIEGAEAEPIQEQTPSPELRGATRSLPTQELILEAVEAAVEKETPAASKPASAAKPEAMPVVPAAPVIPKAVIPPAPAVPKSAAALEKKSEKDAPASEQAPEKAAELKEEALSSVSYASMAQAVVNAKKEPTGRFDRDAIDDDTLLAELYALIGDAKPKQSAETPAKPVSAPAPAPVQTRPAPAPRPAARITADALKDAPEEYVEIEEDTSGVPGWLKGIFILLISLLLSAMTFYAVASDVIGEIF